MREIYENNKDFHDYVDKVAKSRGITVDETLRFSTIKDVGEYYRTQNKGKVNEK